MGGKKEKCGTARSGGGGVLDKSIIDRMMLRFRPIAPKPVVNGSSTGEETSESNKKNNIIMKPKRKYVRVRRSYKPRKRKITPSPAGDEESDIRRNCQQQQQHKSIVTLQLLPERSSVDGGDLLEWGSNVIESRVTVECVTDTCVVDGGEGLLGLRNILEGDTCPGFVSDGFDSVRWVNEAYKKLVAWRDSSGGGDHHGGDQWWRKKEFRVSLVVKEKVKYGLLITPPAFGCRVRVEYTCRDRKCSRTVPCDVWRMDCGGFAWRLDVKAALSLAI